jgi:hypothetical protein
MATEAPAAHAAPTRLRPVPTTSPAWRPRNPARFAAGVLTVGLSMLIVLVAFRSAGQRVAVLVVARDVPAGAQLSDADLTVARVSTDGAIAPIAATDRAGAVGRYTKVRLLRGSLLVAGALQAGPLVDPNAAVVAVQVGAGALPTGLREQSHVWLVLSGTNRTPTVVAATVVSLPDDTGSGTVSLSMSVAVADAAQVATADKVAVLLIDPRATTPPPTFATPASAP